MKREDFSFSKLIFFKNIPFLLFFTFFFIYFLLGLILTYSHDIVLNIRHDLILNLDSGRVYLEFTKPDYRKYVSGHILSPLLYSSSFFIFHKLINITELGFIFMQSLLGSLSVLFMYITLGILNIQKYIKALIILIFGFSFSNLIFSTIPECYFLAGFYNIVLICYAIFLYQKKENLSWTNILVLSFITVLYSGINNINIVNAFILTASLLIAKSIHNKDFYFFLKNITKFILSTICIFCILGYLQNISFPKQQNSFNIVNKIIHERQNYDPINDYGTHSVSFKQIQYSLLGSYVKPLYSLKTKEIEIHTFNLLQSDLHTDNPIWIWHKGIDFYNKLPQDWIPAILLYGVMIFIYFTNRKNYKNNALIISFFIVSFTNFIMNMFYESHHCFLYSQNHLSYLIILLALVQNVENRKLLYVINIAFLIYQLLINFTTLGVLTKFLDTYSSCSTNMLLCIKYALITAFFVYFVSIFIKMLSDKYLTKLSFENKYTVCSCLYALFLLGFSLHLILHAKGI